MIADTMERIARYEGILPQAGALLRMWQEGTPEPAQNVDFEVRCKQYQTKEDAQRKFEVHAHTIDLMIGLAGEELIHICPASELTPGDPLPGGADGMKLEGGPRGSAVLLRPGHFVAIYPGEAHMVGGMTAQDNPGLLQKWVVKLPVKDTCPCTSDCARHGVCTACVVWHRSPSNSLPFCLRAKGRVLIERAMKEHQ